MKLRKRSNKLVLSVLGLLLALAMIPMPVDFVHAAAGGASQPAISLGAASNERGNKVQLGVRFYLRRVGFRSDSRKDAVISDFMSPVLFVKRLVRNTKIIGNNTKKRTGLKEYRVR